MQAGAQSRRKPKDENEQVGCPKGVEGVQVVVQKDFLGCFKLQAERSHTAVSVSNLKASVRSVSNPKASVGLPDAFECCSVLIASGFKFLFHTTRLTFYALGAVE